MNEKDQAVEEVINRYKVVLESQSGHCCFDATVVDASKPHPHYSGKFESVCECFDEADAQRICAALNDSAPQQAGFTATDMSTARAKGFREGAALEPAGWQYRVTAGPQTGWSLWHEGRGEKFEKDYTVERRRVFALVDATPAAPGIDLEQFRPFVQSERDYIAGRIERCDAIGTADRLAALQAKLTECDRLLSLIDARAEVKP